MIVKIEIVKVFVFEILFFLFLKLVLS